MGCGASSGGAAGGAAVAPETGTATPVAERSRLTSLKGNFDLAREVVVMATWTEIVGDGDDATARQKSLSREQLLSVFEGLGKNMTDDEFDVAFRKVDTNGSGKIEFDEFFAWYTEQTEADKRMVRALKVEAELRRRLGTGELEPEEKRAVRSRLAMVELRRRVESHELEPEQAKKVRARLAVLAAMGVGDPPKLEQLSADQMAASIAA